MPVGTIPNFRTRVSKKVGDIDSPKLDPSNDILDLCIEAGLNQYTRIRPRHAVDEIAGTGTQRRFVLNTELTLWESGYSNFEKIASVSDRNTDSETETEISSKNREIRKDTSGNDVLFLSNAIDAAQHLRIQYTSAHIIDPTTAANTTVPDMDTDFLTSLCAGYVAYWIARKASDLSNVSLGSSETSYWRLRQHWADRARELMKEASEYIDPKMVSHESAGAIAEWTSESRLAPRRISH